MNRDITTNDTKILPGMNNALIWLLIFITNSALLFTKYLLCSSGDRIDTRCLKTVIKNILSSVGFNIILHNYC